MTTQTEAERLADALQAEFPGYEVSDVAATELRRLHAVERRYEHIKKMARAMSVSIDGNHAWSMMLRDIKGPNLDAAIDAAIKAGEQP